MAQSAGFDALGKRAAIELRATGEHVKRSRRPDNGLGPQELNVAQLAASGTTSNEIAARLFLSPRTVDTHLRNTFRKLGIKSRRRLRGNPALDADVTR
jgi:DNA-binding CsgD family transcriptional regulator